MNAKSRGINHSLTEADLPEVPEYCPVFPWIKLKYEVGFGRCDGSLSLDRIDNTKGYVPGNIMFMSFKANAAKRNSTLEELCGFRRFCKKTLDILQNIM